MLRKLHHLFSAPSTRVSESNYLLPSAKVDNGESAKDTDFGLRNPLEIGTFLRLLATRQDFLTADYGNGQIINARARHRRKIENVHLRLWSVED